MLPAEAQAHYRVTLGEFCPNPTCNGMEHQPRGGPHFDGPFIVEPLECIGCGATWEAIYALSGYRNLQTT